MTVLEPPHNLEAERASLGTLLISPEAIDRVFDDLDTDDFFLPAHREIYDAAKAIVSRGSRIDVITLKEELRVRGMLPRLDGGEGYLLTIAAEVPIVDNVEHYVRIVRDNAARRRIIAQLEELKLQAYGATPIEELADAGRQAFADIESPSLGGPLLVADCIGQVVDNIEIKCKDPLRYGVPTNLRKFNDEIGHLGPGKITIVAARPGVGKTSWAVNIALNAAIKEKIPSLIFSCEMDTQRVIERCLAIVGRYPARNLHRGLIDRRDWLRIHGAASKLAESRTLWIDDKMYTAERICAIARRWRAKNVPPIVQGALPPKCLIVVDYLQILRVPKGAAKQTRDRIVADMMVALKDMAKTTQAAVIVISQLNRTNEKEQRLPRIDDLRDSGSIEQDADVIVFPHRQVFLDAKGNPLLDQSGASTHFVAKNRDGVCGAIDSYWDAPLMEFTDPPYTQGAMAT